MDGGVASVWVCDKCDVELRKNRSFDAAEIYTCTNSDWGFALNEKGEEGEKEGIF